MDQRELERGDGPIALILVPTRELALQIYSEVKRYAKVYNLTCVCAYGGGNKYEQSKVFEQGAEIAIATPGRMIDMIKMKVTNLTSDLPRARRGGQDVRHGLRAPGSLNLRSREA